MGQEALELSRFYKVKERDVLGGLFDSAKGRGQMEGQLQPLRSRPGRGQIHQSQLGDDKLQRRRYSQWMGRLSHFGFFSRPGALGRAGFRQVRHFVGKNSAESSGKENNHAAQ